MNFLPRVISRISFSNYKVINTSFANYLSTSMPLGVKYGKLINDHVTSTFILPIGDNGDMAAVLYDKQKGLLNLHHVEVPEHLEGQGIGHDIAKEVFEYCSARNLKVLLTCSFLQKFYQENPQYKDIVMVREKMNV